MSIRTVLVTGAAGFLGSEIVRSGTAAGLQIIALDRRTPAEGANIEYRLSDIQDKASLLEALAGANTVIHAAGLAHVFGNAAAMEDRFTAINEVGTRNVLEASAAAGVNHLILISSVAVYGTSGYPYDESRDCHPRSPYATSKWRAEQRAREIAEASGIALTILRLSTLYGAEDPGNMGRLIRLISRGRFVWVGDGSNRKSIIHRTDAARACLVAAAARPAGSAVFNVAVAPHTMAEIVTQISRALGKNVPRVRLSRGVAAPLQKAASAVPGRPRLLAETLAKWLEDDVFDGSRFARTFNFSPEVGLEKGIREEVAWYLGQTHAAK